MGDFGEPQAFLCHVKTHNFAVYMLQLLHAPQAFQDGEALDSSNTWICTSCGCQVEATKKLPLYQLSEIFVVQLKRFKFTAAGAEKLTTPVDFPLEGWDLTTHVQQDQVCTHALSDRQS